MVRIRLRRVGAKKQPSYRVVVADSRSPRDGRFIERLGWYNPRTDPPSFEIQEDRALYWLSVGAQPSDAVARLLKKMGTFEKFERVKAGVSIDEVMAEAAAVETLESEEPLPTEAEIAAEEPADEVDETDEADEAFEETGGEEEEAAA
ncbi:MAG: 30S ribosomal protein S16 [Anaerolineae bacterium]|nr:MAG: 30S ribosomal protein S16 [Anaerolineae bacterium]